MSKKKEKKEIVRLGTYDLDRIYDNPSGSPKGTPNIDEIYQAEMKDKIMEAQELRMETYTAKKRLELKKIQDQDGSATGQPASSNLNLSADDAIKISQLPPEQQQKVMQTLMLLKSSPQGMGGLGSALPFLLSMSQSPATQQMSPMQLLELMMKFNESTKAATPSEKESLTKTLFSELTDLYKAQLASAKDQSQSPIDIMKAFGEAAKTLGFKAPGETTGESETLGMARLKMEDEWKRADWNYKMDDLKTRRMFGYIDKVINTVNPEKIVKGVAREMMRNAVTPQPHANPNAGQSMQVIKYRCGTCGNYFAAPADQTSAVCVVCGTQYPDLAVAASKASRETEQERKQEGKEEEEKGEDGKGEESSGEGGIVRV